MNKTEIFLLDDHKIMRDGLKSILNLHPEFQIIGEESYPKIFLENLPNLKFDLLILDLSLPEISGLEVLKKVKLQRPEIKILMLSMHDSPEYLMKSIKDGANGYLTKDVEANDLIHALKEITTQGSYFPKQLNLGKKSSEIVTAVVDPESDILTTKEKIVLKAMSKGLSSKQIGAEFGLSSRTIETHRLNIMKKLGTSNSAETITKAVKLKMIQIE
ncbi:MAG: response regulator [Bacteriovoracaceae bacterium]